MKILIADDEEIARGILREELSELAGVEVVGDAATGIEAIESLLRLRPDVLLLDMEMPEMDGLAVARNLIGRERPVIIYVTAYSDRALAAFELGAVDYLLKPVRRERLEAALEKARRVLGTGGKGGHAEEKRAETPRKIAGRLGEEVHLLDPSDVIAFVAEGELVRLIGVKGRYFASGTLREWEDRLGSGPFLRVHRGTLVNIDHIRTISPLSSKRWMLRMSNGMEITVSKRSAGLIRGQARA